MKPLFESLKEFDVQDFGEGASKQAIEDAEQQLGVEFPQDYIDFLRDFGWGGVEYMEIYGTGQNVPQYLDVVWITQAERPDMGVSPHAVVIAKNGGGDLYCLNTNRMKDGKCPVVMFDHEQGANQKLEELAEDFASWLQEKNTEI